MTLTAVDAAPFILGAVGVSQALDALTHVVVADQSFRAVFVSFTWWFRGRAKVVIASVILGAVLIRDAFDAETEFVVANQPVGTGSLEVTLLHFNAGQIDAERISVAVTILKALHTDIEVGMAEPTVIAVSVRVAGLRFDVRLDIKFGCNIVDVGVGWRGFVPAVDGNGFSFSSPV